MTRPATDDHGLPGTVNLPAQPTVVRTHPGPLGCAFSGAMAAAGRAAERAQRPTRSSGSTGHDCRRRAPAASPVTVAQGGIRRGRRDGRGVAWPRGRGSESSADTDTDTDTDTAPDSTD